MSTSTTSDQSTTYLSRPPLRFARAAGFLMDRYKCVRPWRAARGRALGAVRPLRSRPLDAAGSGGPRLDFPLMTRRPEHPTSAPLSLHDVTVSYRQTPVLFDVEYTCPPGKLVAIVGPNGAGKSTMLKAALGLIPRDAGQVDFFGRPYRKVRDRVAYVPQRTSVDWDFPVSALEVVTMGLYRKIGWFRPVTRKWRDEALRSLDRVGLADLASRQISELSGGQQQRVFLARAIAQNADLYLMDEPFAGVDAATERTILELLRGLQSEGRTALVVHHDLQTVTDYFDEVLLLNRRVIASGPVGETLSEENVRTTYGGQLVLLDRLGERMRRS